MLLLVFNQPIFLWIQQRLMEKKRKENPKIGDSMDNSVSPTSNSPEELPRNQTLTIPEEQLLTLWRTETNISSRNRIMTEMKKRGLFPDDEYVTKLMEDGGLYPDVEDPVAAARKRATLNAAPGTAAVVSDE